MTLYKQRSSGFYVSWFLSSRLGSAHAEVVSRDMATCDTHPIPPLSKTAYGTKQAKRRKTLEEKREEKKALNKNRDYTRVNIREAFSRW